MPAYGSVVPSLQASPIVWPQQEQQQYTKLTPNVIVKTTMSYNIQTLITVTAIMGWSIGLPVFGQIRQTAQDRTDFAY